MSVENNVPEIRFKGFSGEWVEHKLQDLTENGFSNGVFNDPQKVGKGYRLINVKDMYSGDCIDVDGLSLVDIDEKEFKNNKVQYGDIFFTRSSLVKEGIAYSNVNLSDRSDLTFDGHLIRMQPCKATTDPVFLASLFKTSSARKQLILGGKTTTMTTIGQSDIAIVELALPEKQEQTAIGNTFQKLDNLINQHQQKHDKLSNIKKAMLEHMFPKQGETTPEIRFKGFSGAWESKVLGSVASFYKGKGLPKSSIQDDGLCPCIHYGELFTKYSEVIEIVTSKTNQTDNFFSISNDVLMPTSDVTPKGLVKSCCVKQNGIVLGGDILVIRPNDQNVIDGEFLSRFIRTREQQVLQNVTGSTVFHLYASSIENLDIVFPSIEQQKAIGNYFQKLDALINQHQQQIIKLNNIKQACLSKMFV